MIGEGTYILSGFRFICYLILAKWEDRLPDHGAYADLIKQVGSPDGILEMVSQPNFEYQDSWQVQTQAYVQQKDKVYLYSDGLRDDQIRDAMLEPCRDIDKTIHQLAEEFGDRICAIPEGPLVIVDMEK